MTQPQPHVPTAREQKFLESVEEARYEREIISGLGPFFNEKAPEDMLSFYSKDEVTSLKVLKATDRDVETRMPVKITRHYYDLARTSAAIQRIVKASPDETMDLAGSEDPGHQMDYSPVEGLLHKYEMGLMYVVSTCSAHCRFCYREELIARKQIKRQDGTIAKKGLALIPEIIPYIKQHNAAVAKNGGVHPESGREKLRGLERVDSLSLDPHKWLFQPFECGCVLVRDRALLRAAFRVTADYLREVHRESAEVNLADHGLQLTRGFRALKLWLSIKTFGMAAFRAAVSRGFALAEIAERELRTKPGWEILSRAQMGTVCFRFGAEDAVQTRIVDAMLREGYAFLTSTKLKGAICLRLCTINPRTTDAEMIETVKRLDNCARQCSQ